MGVNCKKNHYEKISIGVYIAEHLLAMISLAKCYKAIFNWIGNLFAVIA